MSEEVCHVSPILSKWIAFQESYGVTPSLQFAGDVECNELD